jgi:hypothetical protein
MAINASGHSRPRRRYMCHRSHESNSCDAIVAALSKNRLYLFNARNGKSNTPTELSAKSLRALPEGRNDCQLTLLPTYNSHTLPSMPSIHAIHTALLDRKSCGFSHLFM